MTSFAPPLRRPFTGDQAIDAAMRDIDDFMRGTLRSTSVPEFDATYTEPMYIGLTGEPVGIVCLRVRPVSQLTAALIAGGAVPFEWDGANKRAKVLKVDGLTVGTDYRFNFMAVG